MLSLEMKSLCAGGPRAMVCQSSDWVPVRLGAWDCVCRGEYWGAWALVRRSACGPVRLLSHEEPCDWCSCATVTCASAWVPVRRCECDCGHRHHGLLSVYFDQFGARALMRLHLGPLAPLPPGIRRRTGTHSGSSLLWVWVCQIYLLNEVSSSVCVYKQLRRFAQCD